MTTKNQKKRVLHEMIDDDADEYSPPKKKIKLNKKESEEELLNALQCDNLNKETEIDCRYLLNVYDVNNKIRKHQYCDLYECLCLKDIVNVMKKYKLYIQENCIERHDNDKRKPCIVNNVYQENANNYNSVDLLDDFNHLLQSHSHEFEGIYNILNNTIYDNNGCILRECLLMTRHQRDRAKVTKNEGLLNKLYFMNDDISIQQLLDRIHCHFMHSFDIGYKLTAKDKQSIMEQEKKSNHEHHIEISSKVLIANIDGLKRPKCRHNQIENIERYSYGYRFYYWEYYRNCQNRCDPVSHYATYSSLDTIDFEHHTNTSLNIGQWYIEPIHSNLKSELLYNNICVIGIKQWQNLLDKAAKHYNTDIAKNMVCLQYQFETYYGIKYGDYVTRNHLIAMMVYCNYDVLSFKFSETYRTLDECESNEEKKQRHRNYYWLGRYLRECVECFGCNMRNNQLMTLKVYHGVNKKFVFSSMNAYIMTPFSSTTDYCVAVNFCGNEGMILELDIDLMQGVNLCDMRYISDFSNESEIFSIGRLYPFLFTTIIEPNGTNYIQYMIGLKQITNTLEMQMKGMKIMYELHGILKHSSDGSDIYSSPSSRDEKQMFFRLLSHRIWEKDASHRYGHEFKKCPVYFKNILNLHLDAIRMIIFDKQGNNKIIDALFRYENGWINLDLITKVFPAVHSIAFVDLEKDLSFWTNKTIYESLLLFFKIRRKYTLNQMQLRIDPKYYQEMQTFLTHDQLKQRFERLGFKIGVKKQEIRKDIWNKINLPDLLSSYDNTRVEQNQLINEWMNKLRNSVGILNENNVETGNVWNGCIVTIYICTIEIFKSYYG